MKKNKSILWGILLIAVGVLIALKAFNIVQISLFFSGWWTLFIIVPCTIGLFTEREKSGNIIGILIGVFLLLSAQDILSFSMLWKLLVPAVVIIIGIKMIYVGIAGKKVSQIICTLENEGKSPKVGCAVFSGTTLDYDGEVFEGAELTASFGGLKCDLRNAIIEKDCAIKVSATFGGITILVPNYVNVKVNANCLFGGIDNKIPVQKGAVTVYVSGICMFGGVEIK